MHVHKAGIILAMSFLATTAAFGQVQQQSSVSALKGHNTNAPVDVSADRIEVRGAWCLLGWLGWARNFRATPSGRLDSRDATLGPV